MKRAGWCGVVCGVVVYDDGNAVGAGWGGVVWCGVAAGVGCGFLMWVARWLLPLEEQETFTGGGVRDLDGRRAGSWEEQRRWVRVGLGRLGWEGWLWNLRRHEICQGLSCPHCGMESPTAKGVGLHVNWCPRNPKDPVTQPFECSCGHRFGRPNTLNRHQRDMGCEGSRGYHCSKFISLCMYGIVLCWI